MCSPRGCLLLLPRHHGENRWSPPARESGQTNSVVIQLARAGTVNLEKRGVLEGDLPIMEPLRAGA